MPVCTNALSEFRNAALQRLYGVYTELKGSWWTLKEGWKAAVVFVVISC